MFRLTLLILANVLANYAFGIITASEFTDFHEPTQKVIDPNTSGIALKKAPALKAEEHKSLWGTRSLLEAKLWRQVFSEKPLINDDSIGNNAAYEVRQTNIELKFKDHRTPNFSSAEHVGTTTSNHVSSPNTPSSRPWNKPDYIAQKAVWGTCFLSLNILEGDEYRSRTECGLCINHFFAGNAPSKEVDQCKTRNKCDKSPELAQCVVSDNAHKPCPFNDYELLVILNRWKKHSMVYDDYFMELKGRCISKADKEFAQVIEEGGLAKWKVHQAPILPTVPEVERECVWPEATKILDKIVTLRASPDVVEACYDEFGVVEGDEDRSISCGACIDHYLWRYAKPSFVIGKVCQTGDFDLFGCDRARPLANCLVQKQLIAEENLSNEQWTMLDNFMRGKPTSRLNKQLWKDPNPQNIFKIHDECIK